jgi:hypothetical protein
MHSAKIQSQGMNGIRFEFLWILVFIWMKKFLFLTGSFV